MSAPATTVPSLASRVTAATDAALAKHAAGRYADRVPLNVTIEVAVISITEKTSKTGKNYRMIEVEYAPNKARDEIYVGATAENATTEALEAGDTCLCYRWMEKSDRNKSGYEFHGLLFGG